MPHQDILPDVFSQYAQHVSYVQKVSNKEWSSTCPKCGGEPHADTGDWPDRCRWFLDDKPLGWCRKCGETMYPDQQEGYEPPSPEQMERWRKEREAAEEARKRSAERALQYLRSSELWKQYHQQLDDYSRKWWLGRGIPKDWQDYWRLGWKHDQIFTSKEKSWMSPVATIPLFDNDWNPLNIKYRLVDAYIAGEIGKYRYELYGQPQPMFLTNPDNDLTGHVIAIEGELKAAVTYIALGDIPTVMVGLPGTNPSKGIVEQLRNAERITLIFDPGSEKQMMKVARQLGIQKCRGVITPEKIDDGIRSAHLTGREIRYLINTGIKLSAFIN